MRNNQMFELHFQLEKQFREEENWRTNERIGESSWMKKVSADEEMVESQRW